MLAVGVSGSAVDATTDARRARRGVTVGVVEQWTWWLRNSLSSLAELPQSGARLLLR
jgi:hypothetical protein